MADLIRFLSILIAFLAIGGLVVGISVAKGCSRSSSEADLAEEIRDVPPVFNMTSHEFVKEYLADEAGSAAAYNGQVGITSGTVIGLSDESNHVRLYGNGTWSVRCFLSDEEMERFRAEWRTKTTSPNLTGRVEGVNDKHLTIDLRGCTVLGLP